MANVQKTIDVPVPVHEAYNQWTQFESFPRFMEGVQEVRQLDDRRLHWRAKVAGREAEWDAEITEQIPDKRIAWRSIGGRGNAGVVDFHRLDDTRTQVSLQMEAETQGATETVGDKLGVLDRQVEGDLKRFRDYIAERGTAEGAYRGRIDRQYPS
jgi:uncharacterized membrane protein